jgi:hypothetical protein
MWLKCFKISRHIYLESCVILFGKSSRNATAGGSEIATTIFISTLLRDQARRIGLTFSLRPAGHSACEEIHLRAG